MGKSRKIHQRISKGSTETGSWLLPALSTKVPGMRKKCRGALVDMPSVSHDPIYLNVLVQSVAIATTYTKKQACLKSSVKASKALFLKSASCCSAISCWRHIVCVEVLQAVCRPSGTRRLHRLGTVIQGSVWPLVCRFHYTSERTSVGQVSYVRLGAKLMSAEQPWVLISIEKP